MSPSLTIMMLTLCVFSHCRICIGYARTLIVDLAFLFEGYDEQTLPERVLGTVRLRNVEFGKKLRFVESFDG